MVTLTKIYTRTGDGGKTRLVGTQQIPKDSLRIDSYGTVDELNAILGLCREELLHPVDGKVLPDEDKARFLEWFQHTQQCLFNLGSDLATLIDDRFPGQPLIREEDVKALEAFIDRENADLGILRSFVLPGGTRLNALLHQARTVCRRAERVTMSLSRQSLIREEGMTKEAWAEADGRINPQAIPYLNRLSDALFVLSRRVVKLVGAEEVLWTW